MSRLRRWLRALGRRVQNEMPDAMAAIHEAKAIACELKSYPEALGSPEAAWLRQGRVARFNRRWYFVSSSCQVAALVRGEAAAQRILDAIAAECARQRLVVCVDRAGRGGRRILI